MKQANKKRAYIIHDNVKKKSASWPTVQYPFSFRILQL